MPTALSQGFSVLSPATPEPKAWACSPARRAGPMAGMNISSGFQKLQQDAANLKISVQDKVDSDRSNAAFFAGRASAAGGLGTAAAALAARGKHNPNLGAPYRNAEMLRLGEETGSAVMGQENWAQYITTSANFMQPQDKPFPSKTTQHLAKLRWRARRMGIPSCRGDRTEVVHDRQDHLPPARSHRTRS